MRTKATKTGQNGSTESVAQAMPLLETIHHKRLKVGFRKFLESEYSVENLDFWLAVEAYKQIKDEKSRCIKAQEIYEDYVAYGAPKQVNLEFYTQTKIAKQMSSRTGTYTGIFNDAQRQIQNLLENDPHPRFLQSAMYEICVNVGRQSPRLFLTKRPKKSPSCQERNIVGRCRWPH